MENFKSLKSFNPETPPPDGDKNGNSKSGLTRRNFLKKAAAFGAILAGGALGEMASGAVKAEAMGGTKESIEQIVLERKEAFEALKLIINREKIIEKLAYLKGMFADAHKKFLYINHIDEDLEWLSRFEEAVKAKGEKAFSENLGFVTPASQIFNAYKERWRDLDVKEIKDLSSREIIVSGFGEIGLSDQDIKKVLDSKSGLYPENWVAPNVGEIMYAELSPEENKKRTQTCGLDNCVVIGETESREGISRLLRKDPRAPIALYNLSKLKTAGKAAAFKEIVSMLDHETAHVNDWANSRILTSGNRINLLYDVAKRYLEGQNRFRSEYVESLKSADIAGLRYKKVKEYWAEICGEFFQNPAKLAQENTEDFRLVKKWISSTNPFYNPAWSINNRNKILQN